MALTESLRVSSSLRKHGALLTVPWQLLHRRYRRTDRGEDIKAQVASWQHRGWAGWRDHITWDKRPDVARTPKQDHRVSEAPTSLTCFHHLQKLSYYLLSTQCPAASDEASVRGFRVAGLFSFLMHDIKRQIWKQKREKEKRQSLRRRTRVCSLWIIHVGSCSSQFVCTLMPFVLLGLGSEARRSPCI